VAKSLPSESEETIVRPLEKLIRATNPLASIVEMEPLLNLVLDNALRLVYAEAGALMMFVEDSGELEIRAVRGAVAQNVVGGRLPANVGLVGSATGRNRSILVNRKHLDKPWHYQPCFDPGFESRTILTMPMRYRSTVTGVIQLINKRDNKFFTGQDQVLLALFLQQAAVTVANVRLTQQLDQASLARAEFISAVSHELKTPLTSILGYTDLLLSGVTGELKEQQVRFLEKVASNVDRMTNQIRDLTDITRLEIGQHKLKRAPIPFATIITESFPAAKEICLAKDIGLHVNMPDDQLNVMADRDRLIQVLAILLNNAAKYSPPGSNITIVARAKSIGMRENAPARPMVVCSVKDNGYGISEEDQKLLFSKFFRSDDPNIRKVKGIGLGLSIAKAIIQLHDGKIWVDSKLGEGSIFHFALPKADAPRHIQTA